MRNWSRELLIVLGAAMASSFLACVPAIGQTAPAKPAYTAPRTPTGQPDLQGIWEVRNTASADLQDHSGSYGVLPGRGRGGRRGDSL